MRGDARVAIGGGKSREIQTRASRRDGFDANKRAIFLDHLAATCNVRMAAQAAGVVEATVYRWRRTWADFAELWTAALSAGYARLEAMLIERAAAGSPRDGEAVPIGETPVPDARHMDTELALALLRHHRGPLEGRPRRGGPPPKRATEEETNAALTKQLKALAKQPRKAG